MEDTPKETGAPNIPSAAEIVNAASQLGNYGYGRPIAPLRAVDRLINATYGQREPRQRIEMELVKLLDADTSLAVKQFVCQKLWMIGTDLSVPALGRLLDNPDARLVEAACYALSRHRSPAVSHLLRSALDSAGGAALAAVINVLGDRRDAEAVGKIAKLASGADAAVAESAVAALGKIATPEAIRALSNLHAKGARRADAAHALLQGGQELAARGNTAAATQVFEKLADSRIAQIRRGARISRGSQASPKQ